jgi:hypothetical protein
MGVNISEGRFQIRTEGLEEAGLLLDRLAGALDETNALIGRLAETRVAVVLENAEDSAETRTSEVSANTEASGISRDERNENAGDNWVF